MQELWIFGYGSLMWRPGFEYLEASLAVIHGYQRSFCIYSVFHRGTGAQPGLVLGLGYVFFYNAGWNPLGFLYGTLTILVINTVAHFYTVGHITALTSLKQLDGEFESVSASLKVPFWSTFRRVTAPIHFALTR